VTPPLAELRAVDLSNTLAGAQVSELLADFGAEVIHVEPPGGSVLRDKPAYPFWARGKKSIELDLRNASDQDVARELAVGSDVLVETFRPGVAERWRVGYESLAAENPGLIYASITGFGRTGPYAQLKGYEGLVMAKLGGFYGFSEMVARRGPAFATVPFCSFSAAQLAIQGILAALYERARSGLGQRVDTSLVQGLGAHDTWNWMVRHVASQYPDAFSAAPPIGDGVPNHPLILRLLVALSADGRWLQFSQTTDRLFKAFMRALGLDWMFSDPEWKTAPDFDDVDKRVEFWERMLESVHSKTLAEWQQLFDDDRDVWAEVFRRGSELLDHPQMLHDHQVVVVTDAERGSVRQPGPLVRLSSTPGSAGCPAPRRDQHGAELRGRRRVAVPARAANEGPRRPPLEGVTVLELGTFYAAPFGATLLADLGARVIKVEPPDGDPIRWLLGFPEVAGIKVLQGKESIAVDVATDQGREIVLQIARRADLVLRSFRAGVAERLGIDADALLAANPNLMYVNAPAYGVDGPCGDRPAFAPTIGAGSGMAWRNIGPSVPAERNLPLSDRKRSALRLSTAAMSVAHADGFAALGVGTGLLLALVARDRGAPGQPILTTMLSTMAHALSEDMIEYEGRAPAPTADPELYGLNARYRLYETADGWVFLAAPTAAEWDGLAASLMPYADLAGDERFASEDDRRRHDDQLAEALASIFRRRRAAEWERALTESGVGCVESANSTPDVVVMEQGLGRESGFVVDVEHPTLGVHPRLAPLVSFSRSTGVAAAAPVVGQHTDAVLRELGYTEERIAALRSDGVVR